tara:strand:+ start:6316 stop:8685 length:2370 start_codon:yes stop_codon:yes gene_type:complete
MYGQARLCNDEPTFFNRLTLLCQSQWELDGRTYDVLGDVIEAALKASVNTRAPTRQAQLYIDVRAFLDGLLGYNESHASVGLSQSQSAAINAPRYLPLALSTDTHLHLAYGDVIIGDQLFFCQKIIAIFSAVNALLKSDYQDSVFLMISSDMHTIALSKADESYRFFDQNQGLHEGSIDEIAAKLWQAFSKGDAPCAVQCLSINTYTLISRLSSYQTTGIWPNHPIVALFVQYQQAMIAANPLLKSYSMYYSYSPTDPWCHLEMMQHLVSMVVSTVINSLSHNSMIKAALANYYCINLHQEGDVAAMLWTDSAKSFYLACQEGYVFTAQAMLASDHVDCRQRRKMGVTPFFIACQEGRLPVVDLMLDSDKVDCNQANEEQVTPFFMACQKGHVLVVQAMLASVRVDCNQVNNDGVTPFFMACQKGHVPVVQIMLTSARVDCNQSDNEGITPFFMACQEGHFSVVQATLASGKIDCNQGDSDGGTPFFKVCQKGYLPIVKAMLASDKVNCNQLDRLGMTPFFIACLEGHFSVVQVMLASDKINCNQANKDGVTPFFVACSNGDFPIVQAMLASDKVDCHQGKANGVTPFFMACQQRHFLVIQAMLANPKVDCNQGKADGVSPFFRLCNNHPSFRALDIKDSNAWLSQSGKYMMGVGEAGKIIVRELQLIDRQQAAPFSSANCIFHETNREYGQLVVSDKTTPPLKVLVTPDYLYVVVVFITGQISVYSLGQLEQAGYLPKKSSVPACGTYTADVEAGQKFFAAKTCLHEQAIELRSQDAEPLKITMGIGC